MIFSSDTDSSTARKEQRGINNHVFAAAYDHNDDSYGYGGIRVVALLERRTLLHFTAMQRSRSITRR